MTSPFVPVLHGAFMDRLDEIDTIRTAEAVAQALSRLGYQTEIIALTADLGALHKLSRARPRAVFNLVESLIGNPVLAALIPHVLDRLGLAYTGCAARPTRRCVSKTKTKRTMARACLPTPAWSDGTTAMPGRDTVIVKSDTEHASFGIDAGSVVPAARAAAEIASREARFGTGFFAEAYVDGREFNLSLLEGATGPKVLPPAEIEFRDFPRDVPRIVDYEAKWSENSFAFSHTPRRFSFPASDGPLLDRLAQLARRVWRVFGLTGYARVDFRVDGAGVPWILEVNTNPCLAPDAGFFAAANRAGESYDTMIAGILAATTRRHLGKAA